jgi:hypothetical protein
MNRHIYNQLEQATARIESMIHLGGMVTSDSVPDAIDDLLQEDDDTLLHVFPDMPEWVKEELNDRLMRGSAFSEWLSQTGKLGFVVQFATPVMRHLGTCGATHYSWGHYYTRWTYGDTLEEALQFGLAWVNERRAAEVEKNSDTSSQTPKG